MLQRGARSRRAGATISGPRYPDGKVDWLTVCGAAHNNLRDIDVSFPLGRFVAVTGVSGSGKSSLVNDIVREALARDLNGADTQPGKHAKITGAEHLDKILDIDQSPIGRTPRSNPATYIKVFDLIRDLYAKLPEAKIRGYQAGRFSFNVPGGRCEACDGNGSNRLEMDFLADVWVTCPVCEGRRFNRETLQIRFKDKSIHDVLEMDVQEALEHFQNVPDIHRMLQTLHDVGLDYLKLGQPSPTLSGGEAQRIKLARELCRKSTGRTFYVLDEPTTGLHFDDIQKLLAVLHGFVDRGNTVVVIEHNLDVIKTADWVIDLGPEGGVEGGAIVALGTPEEVARNPDSYTGRALEAVLSPKRPEKTPAGSGKVERGEPIRHLEIEGACQHNLKNVEARLPLGRMSVFCGPSGSGKSSLAIDTLYAEGQRRYVESLSSYARQFLGQMQKPAVERVHGLSPAICIEQKAASKSPRSTVGTVTEIYDYFRILFARLGKPYCPDCRVPIGTQTSEEIIDRLLLLPEGTRVYLLAPIQIDQYADFDAMWRDLGRSGFQRVRVDGVTGDVSQPPALDRRRHHHVEVVVDRAVIRRNQRCRIADSVEAALDLGRGVLLVAHVDEAVPEPKWRVDRYSQHRSCDRCGRGFVELTPNQFSFNSPMGWCPACEGLGVAAGGTMRQWGDRGDVPLFTGAITTWPSLLLVSEPFPKAIATVGRHAGFSLYQSINRMSPEARRALLYGTGEDWIELGDEFGTQVQYKGIFPTLAEAARVSPAYRHRLADLVGEVTCDTCQGSRLADYPAASRLGDRSIHEWCSLSLAECLAEIRKLKLSKDERKIAGELLREITDRLVFLIDVGLDYLTLARGTPSLSGGEAQRIRLASQLGSGLTGVLYLLDEPTIGLHPRDNGRLLTALEKLRDLKNTVILVEHDREVIARADYLLDFGPGAGRHGGEIVARGAPDAIRDDANSLTGQYLSGRRSIPVPMTRRPGHGTFIEIQGANHHNLSRLDAQIPLGRLVAVTGVSGSGKSSLVVDILWAALARRLHRAQTTPGLHEEIRGLSNIDKVINVDQQPIGNTPASNPATYTGVFDHIRDMFARLPQAKVRGYPASRFSFNKPGGRCESCEGSGQKKIEMHFLPDVWITCEACKGKRYTPETLAVTFKGKSIADVLEMSAAEARELFVHVPKVHQLLDTLCDVGLDYVALGQPAPTLSGGESQRVKLAAELARPNTGRTLYILDEPTTGLHFDDVRRLLVVLHRLVDLGNTVLVIEHNLDLIKTADWVIDMGPEAGEKGGQILFAGTPEDLVASTAGKKKGQPVSHTARALAPVLAAGPLVENCWQSEAEPAKESEPAPVPAELDARVALPWEVDGPRWHTIDRISRTGQPARWSGAALAKVVEDVQSIGGFAPTNWRDRALVEIAAPRGEWFLHALTGEEWILRLKFRVARGTFKSEALNRQLALPPFALIEEIPLYSSGPRVRVRRRPMLYHEVEIQVSRLEDVSTPAFGEFLNAAATSYFKVRKRFTEDPESATPWATDGPGWHESRRGFKPGVRVRWEPALLGRLLRCIEEATPEGSWDYASRDSIKRRFPGMTQAWARIMTKHHRSLELHLVGPKGRWNLSHIDQFGADRSIRDNAERFDAIRFDFVGADDFSPRLLADFLAQHAESFCAKASEVAS